MLTVLRGSRPMAGPVPVGAYHKKEHLSTANIGGFLFLIFVYIVNQDSEFRVQDSGFRIQGPVDSNWWPGTRGKEQGARNKDQGARNKEQGGFLTPNT